MHSNRIIPTKASKMHPLTEAEKWYNNEISKIRIAIEHVNAFLKKFKIIRTRYRNRRKNFNLYFITLKLLIASLRTSLFIILDLFPKIQIQKKLKKFLITLISTLIFL